MPANDVGRYLVPDAIAEHAGMSVRVADGLLKGVASFSLSALAVQEARVLRPRHVDQQAQTDLIYDLQKPIRRHMISAQGIDRRLTHGTQVHPRLPPGRKRLSLRIIGEGAIGHALEAQSIGSP